MTADEAGQVLDVLVEDRLLAIVRGRRHDPGAVVRTVLALVDEGVRLVEVSLTTPGALEAVTAARADLGSQAIVGVGTVLSPQDARRAADAGAQFLLSPGLPDDLPAVLAVGLPTIVGALTPSEVVRAMRAGAGAVKIFPADALGPGYLRALGAPFPDARLVAVGGMDLESCRSFLDAGAVAVGVGSPLVGDAADGGDLDALKRRTRAYREVVAK